MHWTTVSVRKPTFTDWPGSQFWRVREIMAFSLKEGPKPRGSDSESRSGKDREGPVPATDPAVHIVADVEVVGHQVAAVVVVGIQGPHDGFEHVGHALVGEALAHVVVVHAGLGGRLRVEPVIAAHGPD